MSIDYLDEYADIPKCPANRYVTNLMYLIWLSRQDLQQAFDLRTEEGKKGLVQWYEVSVAREYGISPEATEGQFENASNKQSASMPQQIPLHIHLMRIEGYLATQARSLPLSIRKIGKILWLRLLSLSARFAAYRRTGGSSIGERQSFVPIQQKITGRPGANLIGYANAELGMGEHVRMSAAAFSATAVKFGVLNFNVGVSSRQMASLDHGQLSTANPYSVNIFHINADQMLRAYCNLGRKFFVNRYNIGYWAWELAKCPDAWVPVMEMVDEIWAPSRFIQSAFGERTSKPVEYMPLCVTLPPFQSRRRAHFGLPENHFLFLFAFDFFSYIDRKNPIATIRAFQHAFPNRSSPVGLVIKVMNGDPKNPRWLEMMAVIGDDRRIHIINQTMSRGDVLALIDSCNSFVSLHRSEGFGRGPAEAMLLGKPVIVTNYSGNTDFTKTDNSCVVNYRLIPVETGEYVFENGQVWADADVEHAAWYMKRLAENDAYSDDIGHRGRKFIRDNFNPAVIGNIYAKRLTDLRLSI